MIPDTELLSAYAAARDEAAFTEIVRRHLNLVYFAALRRTGGNGGLAEEIAQYVFAEAARKAASLARHATVTGWLYTTTRNAATLALRRERTRVAREQEAQRMHELMATDPAADWEQLRPVIDEALDGLLEREREAVLMRFFEGRAFAAIGATLHMSEDAARMRVERALEKLRVQLRRRGVASTATALAGALTGQSALAAPEGLAASIGGAWGNVAATGASSFTLGALFFRVKFAPYVMPGVAIVLVGVALWQVRARDRLGIATVSVEARSQRLPGTTTSATPLVTDARQSFTASPPPRPVAVDGGHDPRRAGTEIMTRHPEVKQALVDWHVAKVNFQFAPLYEELGLTSEQIARFQELVRGTVLFGDWGARGEFLEFEAARSVPDEAIRAELKQLLGVDGVGRYEASLRTIRPREWTAQLASQLCLTDSPLTPAQAEELVRIFRDAPYRQEDLCVAQTRASAVLSEAQQSVLRRIFAEKSKWAESDAVQRQSAERAAAQEQSAATDGRATATARPTPGGQGAVQDIARVIELSRNDPAVVNADLDAHRPMLAWRFADFVRENGVDGEAREKLLGNAYRGMADERELLAAATSLGLRFDDPAVRGRRMDEDYLAAQRTLLGYERAAALNAYEEQAFLRNIATALAGMTVLADAPMSASQIRQLGDLIVRQVNGPIARRGAAKLEIDWRDLDAAARTLLTERQYVLFISTEAPGGGGGGARFMLRLNQAIHRAVFVARRDD